MLENIIISKLGLSSDNLKQLREEYSLLMSFLFNNDKNVNKQRVVDIKHSFDEKIDKYHKQIDFLKISKDNLVKSLLSQDVSIKELDQLYIKFLRSKKLNKDALNEIKYFVASLSERDVLLEFKDIIEKESDNEVKRTILLSTGKSLYKDLVLLIKKEKNEGVTLASKYNKIIRMRNMLYYIVSELGGGREFNINVLSEILLRTHKILPEYKMSLSEISNKIYSIKGKNLVIQRNISSENNEAVSSENKEVIAMKEVDDSIQSGSTINNNGGNNTPPEDNNENIDTEQILPDWSDLYIETLVAFDRIVNLTEDDIRNNDENRVLRSRTKNKFNNMISKIWSYIVGHIENNGLNTDQDVTIEIQRRNLDTIFGYLQESLEQHQSVLPDNINHYSLLQIYTILRETRPNISQSTNVISQQTLNLPTINDPITKLRHPQGFIPGLNQVVEVPNIDLSTVSINDWIRDLFGVEIQNFDGIIRPATGPHNFRERRPIDQRGDWIQPMSNVQKINIFYNVLLSLGYTDEMFLNLSKSQQFSILQGHIIYNSQSNIQKGDTSSRPTTYMGYIFLETGTLVSNKLVLICPLTGYSTFVIDIDNLDDAKKWLNVDPKDPNLSNDFDKSKVQEISGGKGYDEKLRKVLEGKNNQEKIVSTKDSSESRGEKAPEGWFTNGGLIKKFNASEALIKRIAEKYRETNPAWFKEYLDICNRNNIHYHPELCETIKNEIENRGNKAPEGWKVNSVLARNVNCDVSTIKRIAEKYRKNNSERFKEYLDKSNQSREHYHPELCETIKREIENIREKEHIELWQFQIELSTNLNVSRNAIKRIAEKYRKTNPEWFKKFMSKGLSLREHYSPELCEIIRKEIENRGEKAPEGWCTNNGLSIKYKESKQLIKSFADKYREKNIKLFKEYLDKAGKPTEHYHPELCEIIRKETENRGKKAPEGRYTNNELRKIIGRDYSTTKRIAEKYRKNNSERFKEYLNTGVLREHYSPELCEIIKQEIYSKKPRKTLTMLAEDLATDQEKLQSIINRYKEQNPERFKKHLDNNNQLRGYYHPELCEIIKKELQK